MTTIQVVNFSNDPSPGTQVDEKLNLEHYPVCLMVETHYIIVPGISNSCQTGRGKNNADRNLNLFMFEILTMFFPIELQEKD